MAEATKSAGDASAQALPVPMMWAQRKDKVWITVTLENCKDPKHESKGNVFFFSGKGGTENKQHETSLTLFGDIDPETSKCKASDRQIFFELMKKEQEYWPRLTKDNKKFHFIKTDFNRWKDEDDSDQEEEREDFNLDEMMNSMGGLNGGADFGGQMEEEQEQDSDDEDLPDLQ